MPYGEYEMESAQPLGPPWGSVLRVGPYRISPEEVCDPGAYYSFPTTFL